jgi:hypothetical protein
VAAQPAAPAKDTAVIFFHAHNPWGFAHKTRVTEENVDLNRNFIDFRSRCRRTAATKDLHPLIAIRDWNETAIAGVFAGLDAYREKVGEKAFLGRLQRRPVHRARTASSTAACRPQWSNDAFRAAVRQHLSARARSPSWTCIPASAPGASTSTCASIRRARRARARARLVGRARGEPAGRDAQEARHLQRHHHRRRRRNAAAGEVTCIVVEFGTRPRHEMQRASMAQRWMRFEGPRDPVLAAKVRREYEAAFYPADTEWRRRVLEQSRDFIDRGVAGISSS